MRNNLIFKLLFVFIFSILVTLQVFAAGNNNILKNISIEKTSDNSYALSMFFKDNYNDKAFIQKNENGFYYVYLPNTEIGKNVKIKYKNRKDKFKINLSLDDKEKNNGNLQYTKISVKMDKDYSIKLLSTKSNGHSVFWQIIFWLIGLSIVGYLIKNIFNSSEIRSIHGNYSPIPMNRKNRFSNNSNFKIPRIVLPLSEINQSLKFADKLNFDCFNIKSEPINQNEYNFRSTLSETSKILNDKSNYVMLKHTNPITDRNQASELSMPVIEDANTQSDNSPNKAPEVISVLRINENTGFYLTNYNDTMALFGYINNKVFLLEKFKDLSQINLQARYYDKSGDSDIYILRLDNYKAMVEISNNEMKELARL